MAYVGTTAASTLANPPKRIDGGLLSMRNIRESTSVAEGGGLWVYNSTNQTVALSATAGFFTDAGRLGMRNGDVMIAATYSTQKSTGHILCIGMIAFGTTESAFMSTGGMITSTFG